MIETNALTKRFGKVDAVRDVTFTAAPGRVTGFLGMNGSGKTTTLRMLLGLTRPTSGSALVNGQPYSALKDPLRQVGVRLAAPLSFETRLRVRGREPHRLWQAYEQAGAVVTTAAGGNPRGLLFFAGWTAPALAVALWSIRRDLSD
ncbi:ABC transporter family protein [Paractinoplanes brasiliensis]|uniref:ABC transporter family protein n=1 Tax=Paractinoplanes brasiliensis TaxID=52695 RepID=A0A4R6JNJ9_9ACTN|nr:ABC transporter family protein [Actinoplanes brasiliensis]GID29214.1 hypothetical protein Abr02nite_41970 [Actinoplanes brasiliensis]